MKHFPIVALILALAVTAKAVVKIGNLVDLSPANISGHVYMNDENTIVIKDFKIERGLAGKVIYPKYSNTDYLLWHAQLIVCAVKY